MWVNVSGAGQIGSFWHPIPPPGFHSLGSIVWALENPAVPTTHYAAVVVKASEGSNALVPPADYQLMWVDDGMDQQLRCSMWKPIPPNDNYVALGLVAQTGWDKPSLNAVRCVKKSLTVVGQIDTWIWSTYLSEANYAFVAWDIEIPQGSYNEQLYLDAGGFMGYLSDDTPSPDDVTRVLAVDIPLLIDGSYESYVPTLENYDEPPAISTPVMARAILVPFNAIFDPLYLDDVHWQVTNSPFYRLERNVRYKLIGHAYNGGSADFVLSEATTVGFEVTRSSEWWLETGVEMTVGGGVNVGVASASVSATVSLSMGFKKSTSITSLVYQELQKTLTIPPGKAGALWQKWNWFVLKRHDGSDLELVGSTAEFGSTSWVTDDYSD